MEHILSTTEAVLLDLLTPEQLALVAEDTGVAEAMRAKAEAKAKEESLSELKNLLATIDLPTPPEGVYNLYIPYRQDKRLLLKKEREELVKANPNLTDVDLDNRMVELQTFSWGEWVINKALTMAGSGAKAESRTRKLAITLNKREGSSLVPIGNFRTSKEALEFLGIPESKSSSRLVLQNGGYIVDNYDGQDFKIKT